MIRCYPTTCTRPGCDREAWLDEPGGSDRLLPGQDVTCDCGARVQVRVVMPRAVGILVEEYNPQIKRTFNSNAAKKEWMEHGRPIVEDGEVVGFRRAREYSHDELDAQTQGEWAAMEDIARKNGRTLEEDAAYRADCCNERRARDIEAGLAPTVAATRAEDLLPA